MTGKLNQRRRQFSLRGLLILVTLAALALGWFAWRLQRARVRDEAAEAIVQAGGQVAYANQFKGGVSRLTPRPPTTSWIGARSQATFGADPFRRLVSVTIHDDATASLVPKYGLTDLKIVRLEGLGITDAALSQIQDCRAVRVLMLDFSGVTDEGLDPIRQFNRLEELWLYNTRISDAGLQKLAHLRSLSCLDIRSTQVSDDGLRVVASLPALSLLYLDGGLLTDDGLKNLRLAPNLFNLWLGPQSSAALDLGVLADFPKLESLTLTGSLITDDRLKPLATNQQIHQLNLQGCTLLTDESLAILATMPGLHSLGLRGTPSSPKAITEFKTKQPNCTIW